MTNAFDPASAQEGEPYEVVVGDFIQWKRSDLAATYDPADYTLTYVARVTAGGSSEIKVSNDSSETDTFLMTVSSADSVDFAAGVYHWQAEIIRKSDDERIVVDRGEFTAIVDLDINGTDPRTHADIMLAKIESLLEGRADSDVANYSIQGRSLSKMTFAELIEARNFYREEVAAHKRKNDIKLGRATPQTIQVRFTR